MAFISFGGTVAAQNSSDEYWKSWNSIREDEDWKSGIVLLSKALKAYPDEIGFHVWLNHCLREDGLIQEAYEQIQEVYDRFPADVYVIASYSTSLLSLGWEYYSAGHIESGFALFETAFEINPDDEWVQNAHGCVLRDTGKLEDAISFFENAFELHPDNRYIKENYLYSLSYMGDRLRDLGSYNGAAVFYNTALRLQPDNEWVHLSFGRSERLDGNYAEAISHFDGVLEVSPQNDFVIGNLVTTYLDYERSLFASGDINEATKMTRHALYRFPREIWLLMDLIDYDYQAGLVKRAGESLVDFANPGGLRENGEPIEVPTDFLHQKLEAIVTKFCERQEYDAALAVIREIESLYPGAYFVENARGKLLYFHGDREEGIKAAYRAYDSFIAGSPDNLEEVVVDFPMSGFFSILGNSQQDAITHAGLHQYCFDFTGSDSRGRIRDTNIGRLGQNADYFGFGAEIYSPVSGRIERVVDRFPDIDPTDVPVLQDGNSITIRDERGFHYHFVHIKQFSASVGEGDLVAAGDRIALLGNSGYSTIPHLHFAVYSPDWIVTVPVLFAGYSILATDGSTIEVVRARPETGQIIHHQR